MRFILPILLFLSLSVAAQQPTGNPTLYNGKWYKYTQYLGFDSALLVGSKDTNWTPRQPAIVLWEHSGVDTSLWLYDRYWRKIGGSSGGTDAAAFHQGGDSRGITNILGTGDDYDLSIRRRGLQYMLLNGGNVFFGTKQASLSTNRSIDTFGNAVLQTVSSLYSLQIPKDTSRNTLSDPNYARISGSAADGRVYYQNYNGGNWKKLAYITDTADLSGYAKADSSIWQTKYRTDTSRNNIYTAIGSKGNVTGTGVAQRIPFWNGTSSQSYSNNFTIDSVLGKMYVSNKRVVDTTDLAAYAKADSSVWQPKYRSDTMRASVYNQLAGKQATLTANLPIKLTGVTLSADTGRGTSQLPTGYDLNKVRDSVSLTAGNTITISSNIINVKNDTCTLTTFGAGSGIAGDTAAFTTLSLYGSFYNSGNDTLIITAMQIGLQGTSPSIAATVWVNDTLAAATGGGFQLVTGGTTATNIYTGTNVTSFSNNKIPPNVWVWVQTPTVTTKPTYFTLTLIGYKKRV